MLLETKNLSYTYQSEENRFLFPDLHLNVGEELLILGKSGSGKTTLLHLISLLLPSTHGEIRFDGKLISTLTIKKQNELRGSQMGIVHQKPYFVPSLNCLDNIKLGSYYTGKSFNKQLCIEKAERLGLSNLLTKKPSELSGGELQRVSILRAVNHNPKIIFADEPTSNLDDDNCDRVYELLNEVCSSTGASLVIVTHDHRLKTKVNNQIEL